jgi:hypothetical protein
MRHACRYMHSEEHSVHTRTCTYASWTHSNKCLQCGPGSIMESRSGELKTQSWIASRFSIILTMHLLRTAPHKQKITGGGRARRPWLWIHDVDVGQRAAPRRSILWWWAGESYSTVGARSFPRRRCHVSLAISQSRRSTNFLLLLTVCSAVKS